MFSNAVDSGCMKCLLHAYSSSTDGMTLVSCRNFANLPSAPGTEEIAKYSLL